MKAHRTICRCAWGRLSSFSFHFFLGGNQRLEQSPESEYAHTEEVDPCSRMRSGGSVDTVKGKQPAPNDVCVYIYMYCIRLELSCPELCEVVPSCAPIVLA